MFDSLMIPGVIETVPATLNAAASTVQIAAQAFDPGVTPQSDAPFLPQARQVAGWAMVLGGVFLVVITVVGGVLIGTGKISNTPGNQSKGFLVVIFAMFGAAIVFGASAWVRFGSGIGVTA